MKKVMTAIEKLRLISEGSLDPLTSIEEAFRNIRRCEPKVNAYISLDSEEVIAEKMKNLREEGKLSELLIAVKDNISTKFMTTTAGSRVLEGYIPPFDATAIKKVKKEGGIIIGKTNLDEFAMGSTTELSAFGPTRNPWNLERVVGGSSGGSAAALAYGGCDLALGSDTGGSVRLPASYTATYSLKPTYGLVSRYGLIPYANSLEQISPIARSVEDLALLLEVISGWDPRDATTLKIDKLSLRNVTPQDLGKIKICTSSSLVAMAENEVEREFWRFIKKLEDEGAEVEDVTIPWGKEALSAYYTIAFAEASSNLLRYDGILYPTESIGRTYEEHVLLARKRFGFEVKRRILLGTFILSEGYKDKYYVMAARLRRLVRNSLIKITSRCLIVLPTSPTLPPKLGERIRDPITLYALDIYNVIANLAGVPALSFPIGFSSGLPIGAQIVSGPLEERKLIAVGLSIEELTGIKGVMADGC